MWFLALSLAALAVGPVVHHLTHRQRGALAALEGFVLGAIGALVLLHIMPDCVEQGGWLCLAPAALGLLGPDLFERLLHRAAHRVHLMALLLALAGLLLHATLDGVALAGSSAGQMGRSGTRLALAVVLHRVPVGLTIWLLLRPGRPLLVPVATLSLVACATVAGFAAGEPLLGSVSATSLAWFQSLVAGTLLHVVLHRPHDHDHHERRSHRLQSAGGALLGLGLVVLLSLLH